MNLAKWCAGRAGTYPAAYFLCADILSVDFPHASFDAVVAFYSVFHVPREQHADLFRRVHGWLKPRGHLLCTLSDHPEKGYTEDGFFGVTMYWSNYGIDEYRDLLTGIGFSLLELSTTGHGYQDRPQQSSERHPLILAQKELTRRWRRLLHAVGVATHNDGQGTV